MALTAAQMTDARRFLGYGLSGTTQPVNGDQDTVYLGFGMITMSLYTRLTSLSASEEAILVNYLGNLTQLEAAVIAAGANLDTDKAAVWTRNRSEVWDRTALYNQQRRAFADFLGCPHGPALAGGRLLRG